MASLRDLITGREEKAKQDRIKASAEDFAAKQDPQGLAPKEEGVTEDSFIPDTEDDMKRNGWKVGGVPFGPSAGAGAAAGDLGAVSKLAKLREAGVPESALTEAANNIRTSGSHTFMGPGGKPAMTVGESSPLGQELRDLGRAGATASEETAPALDYGETARVDGTGIARMNKRKGGK
jgi:hypothetical protein